MDIITFSKDLEARMHTSLGNLNPCHDEIPKIAEALATIYDLIHELKTFVRSYKFNSQTEEVQFFKEVKPLFLSQYFYLKRMYSIRLFDSFKKAKHRQAGKLQLLGRIEKYTRRNLEFYKYCLSGNTQMDALYFTLNTNNPNSPNRDERFTTGYDSKLARIMANERIKDYIIKSSDSIKTIQSNLSWTGSKTDLIELIYALHATEVFNNGNVDLKHLAKTFETLFAVNLGNYYRTFQDIRNRKKEQLKFLEELSKNLNQKLNEKD